MADGDQFVIAHRGEQTPHSLDQQKLHLVGPPLDRRAEGPRIDGRPLRPGRQWGGQRGGKPLWTDPLAGILAPQGRPQGLDIAPARPLGGLLDSRRDWFAAPYPHSLATQHAENRRGQMGLADPGVGACHEQSSTTRHCHH